MKKSLGTPNWVRNWGFCHFLKATSLVFLDIVEDHRQCLTSNRAETTKKLLAQIGAELILSILVSWIHVLLYPLNANPTKWSNTLKQFVGCCGRIVWVCLTILRGWRLKGKYSCTQVYYFVSLQNSMENCSYTLKFRKTRIQIWKWSKL